MTQHIRDQDAFAATFFLLLFLASARRSVFFRRDARFLTLSLPWLFPISRNLALLQPIPKLFRFAGYRLSDKWPGGRSVC